MAVPQELRTGGVACTSKPPAEACEQLNCLAQVSGWGEVARAGEGGEHTQLDVAEQHLGGQLGHLAPEPHHQLDAPGDDRLDGDGPFEALGGMVLKLLD